MTVTRKYKLKRLLEYISMQYIFALLLYALCCEPYYTSYVVNLIIRPMLWTFIIRPVLWTFIIRPMVWTYYTPYVVDLIICAMLWTFIIRPVVWTNYTPYVVDLIIRAMSCTLPRKCRNQITYHMPVPIPFS
jgi:hypothetical protein